MKIKEELLKLEKDAKRVKENYQDFGIGFIEVLNKALNIICEQQNIIKSHEQNIAEFGNRLSSPPVCSNCEFMLTNKSNVEE